MTDLSRLWRYGWRMNRAERSRVLLAALVFGGAAFLLGVSGPPDQGVHARAKDAPEEMTSPLRDSVMPLPMITSDR